MPRSNPSSRRSRRASSRIPRPVRALSGLQQIHERTTSIGASAAGTLSQSWLISPAALITAARIAGYRAIADEVRIDLVRCELVPILGSASTGRTVLYIERDATAAAVATVTLANDQREKVAGQIHSPLSLSWRPQEPMDLEFNLLNPGTTALGHFTVIGDNITDAAAAAFTGSCYTVQFFIAMTLRGRP